LPIEWPSQAVRDCKIAICLSSGWGDADSFWRFRKFTNG
jgi:hypothetical protein